MRGIFAVALLVFLHTPVKGADLTVKDYQTQVHSRDQMTAATVKMYVMGIGQGIAWANAAAEKNGAPIFCQPRNFSINGTNYINILDEMITKLESKTTAKELNDYPVGMLLLMGMQQAFPCEPAK